MKAPKRYRLQPHHKRALETVADMGVWASCQYPQASEMSKRAYELTNLVEAFLNDFADDVRDAEFR